MNNEKTLGASRARVLIAGLVSLAMVLAALVGLVGCTSDDGTGSQLDVTISVVDDTPDGGSDIVEPADDTTTGVDPGASTSSAQSQSEASSASDKLTVEEDGWYTSKEEVALYIHIYGHLPGNYVSKTKARKAGWVSGKGNLDKVLPGKSIGGSEFYNDEGLLPDAPGRVWTECDINYHGGYRGSERIVFSNDGLVFYTDDHYKSYERLY